MALLCVTAPLALTVRLPPTVEAPSVSALASVIATLFAPLLLSDTAPRKSFVALVSVIAAAPALKLEAPVPVEMFVPPACVIAPVEFTVSVPVPAALMLTLPNWIALVSVTAMLLLPVLVSDTAPVKSLPALVSVIALVPALKLTAPPPAVCVIAPDCVIAPAEVTPMAPVPTADVPAPKLTPPVALMNASPLLVLKVRLVTATSMALLPPVAPMLPPAFRALRFRLVAVIVFAVVFPSVNDPALSVTVFAPKLTAAPMVIAPVLAAASPITMEPAPVTPPARSVTSAALRSNVEAPASDIVVAALDGLSVSTPVVWNALLPVLAVIATVFAVTVIGPVPAMMSTLAWV